MPILINGLCISTRGAGISRYADGLVRALLANEAWARQLTVALQGSVRSIGERASKIILFPDLHESHRRIFAEQVRLIPHVLRHQLVHYLDFAPPIIAPHKAIVTVHDLAVFRFPECYTTGQRLWKQALTRLAVQKAKHLIAISNFTKREIIDIFGIAENRITVIPNGFDPLAWRSTSATRPPRPSEQRPYFLYVGTRAPQKNLVRLVRALGVARRKYGLPHQLVLVGKAGWDEESLFREIRNQNLQSDVLLRGFLPDHEMASLYSGASAVTYVSLYEGFGYPPLEAMSLGVPVICSKAASLPEIVGDAGLLVDPLDEDSIAQAMVDVASSEKLRATLIQKGLSRVNEFPWEQCARRTFETYQRLETEC